MKNTYKYKHKCKNDIVEGKWEEIKKGRMRK